MRLDDLLKHKQFDLIWDTYCSFLDIDLNEYMHIQNRLMLEQLSLWSNCGLGQKLLHGQRPQTIADFRRMLPLTDYADYADILLKKNTAMLPDEPVIWLETTWEGGKNPIKLAPYTRSMLDTYKDNLIGALVLCTSREKGRFSLRSGDKTLYGFAPLPYATGLFPLLLNEEINLKYLPSLEDGKDLSFSERNKRGFAQGMNNGIDLCFGMSSVVTAMTEALMAKTAAGGKSGGSMLNKSAKMITRMIKAGYQSRVENRPIPPADLFKLKGFVCAGTDSACYKGFLAKYWGQKPMEIAAGTEPTLIGTEDWQRDGLTFFPDACFYEFIPEGEMAKNYANPNYQPKTYLMNELVADHNYELVITVLKGGAFARYRVGDVYRCISAGKDSGSRHLPRFNFVDRVPQVIDIAGFTRITEQMIDEVIELSGLKIIDFAATKEHDDMQRPYLHLYIELDAEMMIQIALSKKLLTEHLNAYFRYYDSDYNDLKRLLGVDPLEITILRNGTYAAYKQKHGDIAKINPSPYQILELLQMQNMTK